MRSPGLGLRRRATPSRREDDADCSLVLGLHEQLRKGRVRVVGRGRRKHDLGVRRQVDGPDTIAQVRDRDTADFRIALGRDDDVHRRDQVPVAANELGTGFAERHLVVVRLDPGRLVTGGPDLAAVQVAQEDIRAPRVTGRVGTPAGDREIAPPAVSGAGRRQHHGVVAVRQQSRARRGVVRGVQRPGQRRDHVVGLGALAGLRDPRDRHRNVARRSLLQQQLRGPDARFRVKPPAHPAVLQRVGERHDGHALVVSHVGAHDRKRLSRRQAPRRVVHSLVEAVATLGGDAGSAARN